MHPGVAISDLIAGKAAQLHGAAGVRVPMGIGPPASDYAGLPDPSAPRGKSGLKALEDVTDVAIVAAPGSTCPGAGSDPTQIPYLNALQTTFNLITHCEAMKYRIAVLDSPDNYSVSDITSWRGQIDSSYAALYYPWVQILDPISNTEITLPPSGFVAGIYARSDQEVGAHKAPANEVVTDALGFELMLNKGQQDVLNPIGVNCFRFFENRGYRLWGARTATSNTEWMYVNVRRMAIYIEHSIDLGTQYVVFENNGPDTWASTQQIVSDFLRSAFLGGMLFRHHSTAGLLCALRPYHHDPERHRQRPPGLSGRSGFTASGRIRHFPHRPDHRQQQPNGQTRSFGDKERHLTMAVPFRDTPYGQFNFRVDLGTGSPGKDDVKAGFQEISGLGMEVHVAEYRAGNSKENATQKITGTTKVDKNIVGSSAA